LRGSNDASQNSYEFFAVTAYVRQCALRFGLSVQIILSKSMQGLKVCDYSYYYYYYYYAVVVIVVVVAVVFVSLHGSCFFDTFL
jgi:hypothetical protein